MPLVDTDLEQTWNELYTGGFIRANKEAILGSRGLPPGQGDHWRLAKALNLQPGQSIVIMGAGFGWVAEDWVAGGLGQISCVDNSAYIHSNKNEHAVVPLHNENGQTQASRARIRQTLNLQGQVRADWCISEDVLPVLSDAEASQFIASMRLIGATAAHWVSISVNPANSDPRLNWKTLEQWKAIVAPDLVVERGTERVL